ncbi:hypothetical protein ABBQ32_011183 [Trebouxia sp. C0010 RCD-2024]
MAKVESHTAGLEATQEEARKQATAVQQSAVEAQTNGAEQTWLRGGVKRLKIQEVEEKAASLESELSGIRKESKAKQEGPN